MTEAGNGKGTEWQEQKHAMALAETGSGIGTRQWQKQGVTVAEVEN